MQEQNSPSLWCLGTEATQPEGTISFSFQNVIKDRGLIAPEEKKKERKIKPEKHFQVSSFAGYRKPRDKLSWMERQITGLGRERLWGAKGGAAECQAQGGLASGSRTMRPLDSQPQLFFLKTEGGA